MIVPKHCDELRWSRNVIADSKWRLPPHGAGGSSLATGDGGPSLATSCCAIVDSFQPADRQLGLLARHEQLHTHRPADGTDHLCDDTVASSVPHPPCATRVDPPLLVESQTSVPVASEVEDLPVALPAAPPGCHVFSDNGSVDLPSSYPPLPVAGFRSYRSRSLGGCRITLATDFSGLETPSMAPSGLGADVELISVSEQQVHLRAFIRENFEPRNVLASAGARTSYRTDFYVAGPPCVKFSALGSRLGEPDPENSTFELSLTHIELAKPVVFVLENVCGLISYKQGSFFRSVLALVIAAAYLSRGNESTSSV